MPKVVIVGGGLSGCGAALAALKMGVEVTLLERTDMLVGVAVRAGETNGNGWFTGRYELNYMGGPELFDALESIKLHDSVKFPDSPTHGYIFNCGLVEPTIKKLIMKAGPEIRFESRFVDVTKKGGRILSLKLDKGKGTVTGDVFVDATGSRGGLSICNKYGKGCVLCLVKCVAFGDRLGICEKAGAKLFDLHRPDGTIGQLGAGVTMYKSTLAPDLLKRLEKEGLLKIPLPPHLIDLSKLKMMGAGRSQAFLENVILGDIGPVAKAFGMVYMPLEKVRQIPGFENVQMENPMYSSFNHVGFVAMAYRDNAFRVEGFENLLCAGEKADHGSVGGAIISGYMAGHNAARIALGKEPVVLPRTLALGDFIAYTQEKSHTEEGHTRTYQMARGEYWQRLQDTGLYTDDLEKIRKRVQDSGLEGFLNKKLS